MKWVPVFCASIALASPVTAAEPQVAESKLAHSSVSVAVEPQLNDGRLVIKIAAMNGTAAPVSFGPGSVSISTVAGEARSLRPLQKNGNEVRAAAGGETGGVAAPTATP